MILSQLIYLSDEDEEGTNVDRREDLSVDRCKDDNVDRHTDVNIDRQPTPPTPQAAPAAPVVERVYQPLPPTPLYPHKSSSQTKIGKINLQKGNRQDQRSDAAK